MIDIAILRANPEAVKENMVKKFQHSKLHLVDEVNYLRTIGISKLRLEFTTENKRDVMEVVDGYNNESLELLGVTNGYY